jgi:hypothetical protein
VVGLECLYTPAYGLHQVLLEPEESYMGGTIERIRRVPAHRMCDKITFGVLDRLKCSQNTPQPGGGLGI